MPETNATKLPTPTALASATCYAAMYPDLKAAAKKCGYALTVHGSLARDFDLVAVPWVDEAEAPEVLIDALVEASNGMLWDEAHNQANACVLHSLRTQNMVQKPHGRMAWTIYLGGGPYLDVSVMPRMPHNDKS